MLKEAHTLETHFHAVNLNIIYSFGAQPHLILWSVLFILLISFNQSETSVGFMKSKSTMLFALL